MDAMQCASGFIEAVAPAVLQVNPPPIGVVIDPLDAWVSARLGAGAWLPHFVSLSLRQ